MGDRTAVLHVGTDSRLRSELRRAVESLAGTVEVASDATAALVRLQQFRREITVIVMEAEQPESSCLDALRIIRDFDPDLRILLAGSESPSPSVVTGLKNGATDFLCLPATAEEWRRAVTGIGSGTCQDTAPSRAAKTVPAGEPFLGHSAGMAAIAAVLGQVAWSDAPVLIQGETGSGKEVIAREVHARSRRAKKPFVKLNCAALPSELVESELFGYERGAFTGAFQRKPGMFEAADGGTLLLDEIGDMDVHLQAKLLQVLQDSEFQRIGGRETIKVDVRVIAATHRNLENAIEEGVFREDLYYRINVINLVVPPLRERKDDIPGLLDLLLHKHAKPGVEIPAIPAELHTAMRASDWPGNVRELENFARKFLIFQDAGAMIRDLRARRTRPVQTVQAAPSTTPQQRPEGPERPILEQVSETRRQAEGEAILAALNATRWNRKHAAAMLQIDYKALLYKMKKLGMDQEPAAASAAAASFRTAC